MPATISAKALREKRANVIATAREIIDNDADERGNLPDDRQAVFDRAMAEANELLDAAKQIERLEILEADLKMPVGSGFDPSDNTDSKPARQSIAIRTNLRDAAGKPIYKLLPAGFRGSREYQSAFAAFCRNGEASLTHEQFAALQSDDADQAGYLIASEQFAAGILRVVDDLLFVRQFATIHTVLEAKSLGIRKRTALASTFAWSSELVVSTEDSTLAFGKKVLTPHHLTGMIKISRDLLRNSPEPADELVRYEMGVNAGNAMETGYLTGSGAQQPLGVFTASSDGISTSRDVSSGSATSISADSLITAKYTLKSQYRRDDRTRWLFHRDAVSILAKLKDAENQYLFRTGLGLRGEDPDRLLNIPLDESERAPNTFTASQYVGLLACWPCYEIADSLDLEMQVVTELYAATNQVGYIGRIKTDGMPTVEEGFARLKTDAS